MTSSENAPTPVPQEDPIPLTQLRRNTPQAFSASTLSSTGSTSNHTSSTSLSPPRTPNTTTSPPCSLQSTSQTPTSAPCSAPVGDQDPFRDNAEANTDSSWLSAPRRMRTRLSQGVWLQNTIGMAGLAVALVALFVYAYRGYKMDKFENLMGLYQACASLKQANISGGARCDRLLSKGPPDRPYGKRAQAMNIDWRAQRLPKRGQSEDVISKPLLFELQCFSNLGDSVQNSCWLQSPLAVICIMMMLWLARILVLIPIQMLARMRYQSTEQPVFTSEARIESSVKVTKHHLEGIQTDHTPGSVSEPVKITEAKPHTGETVRDVRRRLKHKVQEKENQVGSKISWQPPTASSSSSTLVDDHHLSDDEKHHNSLSELRPKDKTRNFFEPDTGETFHLSAWKSRKQSPKEQDSDASVDEGEVQKKVTHTGVGTAVLGAGIAAEEQLHQNAQCESEKRPQ